MFKVGMNPYGMMVAIGLQGAGTARGATQPLGLSGYIDFAEKMGVRCIEFDFTHIDQLTTEERASLYARYQAKGVPVVLSAGPPAEHMPKAIHLAEQIGAKLIRMSMTSVLCGDRAAHGEVWFENIRRARQALIEYAPVAKDRGIDFAVEDHQDVGSKELLQFADEAGTNVGVCFDTGNALAVGEDVLAFARRVAPRVKHLHLKDYRVQFTDEGYRLVRCAIGEGCVPFAEVWELLKSHLTHLTVSMEPGALEARHVRLFTSSWWEGYAPHDAAELGQAIGTARINRIPDEEDWQTPWEHNDPGDDIAKFEVEMMQRSFENVRSWGWL
jgi:sugar phosphate isomerase/epimerase